VIENADCDINKEQLDKDLIAAIKIVLHFMIFVSERKRKKTERHFMKRSQCIFKRFWSRLRMRLFAIILL